MVNIDYAIRSMREDSIIDMMDGKYQKNRVTYEEESSTVAVYDIQNIAVVATNDNEEGVDGLTIFGDRDSHAALKSKLEEELNVELVNSS